MCFGHHGSDLATLDSISEPVLPQGSREEPGRTASRHTGLVSSTRIGPEGQGLLSGGNHDMTARGRHTVGEPAGGDSQSPGAVGALSQESQTLTVKPIMDHNRWVTASE